MKGIAAVILLLSTTAPSAAAAAIRCQDAPGLEHGAHWSWREIDGKRCWFIRAGDTMPPKSAFTWAKEEGAKKNVSPEQTKTGQTVRMLKVKAEEMSDVRANWLDDAPVELIVGGDLSGSFGVGGSWVVPAYAATAATTSFAAPFAPAR